MGRYGWLAALAACGGGAGKGGPPGDADADTDTDTDADADADTDTDPPDCFTLADGRCEPETFRNPPVLTPDADGVHHLTLAPTEVVLAGQRHCVRAYNGVYPGPTIDTPARAGADRSVRVDLVNGLVDHAYQSLSGEACTCADAAGDDCLPEHVHDACADPDADPCRCRNEDGEECHMADMNVTNLHAHGSHVRPDYARGGEGCVSEVIDGVWVACRECGADVCDGDSDDDACFHGDNVLNAVHPWSGARYRWDVDEDGEHHAGLQWYHPHIHGTTAMQVGSGAAGAWIVRGEVDALPGLVDARERVMVFTTPPIAGEDGFQPLEAGEACTEETLTFDSFHTLSGTFGTQTNLLNDARRPRMITAPGQVERWRILHAGFLDEVFLGLFRGEDGDCASWSTDDAMSLTQIGRDGILLPEAYADDYLFFSPGYRTELVFGGEGRLAHGETWCLVAARFLQAPQDDGFLEQPSSPPVPPTREEVFARFETDGDLVATLNVTDDAVATTTRLPDLDAIAALAPSVDVGGRPIDPQCEAAAARTDVADLDQAAVLQVGFWTVDDPDPCGCADHNVNCKNFEEADRDRYPFDRDLVLGEVDHWRVGASVDGHPFHIHINPYVVCPNPSVFDPIPFAHWRDTYLVNADRRVDLLTQNRAFTGPYVFHCHKLTHEDEGMMELVRVCDPADDASCGDNAWDACDADDLGCRQALAATECALEAEGTLGAAACVQRLGGPGGICAPNACATDDDCSDADRCDADACAPAPCPGPCPPGDTCVHGTCR